MRSKKIVLLFILGIITVIIIGLLKYNKPHLNVEKTNSEISISSKTLLDEFVGNEEVANSKYLGEVIEVAGVIKKLDSLKGKAIITLGEGDFIGNVVCHLLPEENEKVKALKKNQMITIKGVCTGYLMDVILVQSILIN